MNGIIVLTTYAILMMAVTVCLSRRAKTTESFHVADRKLGLIQTP